LTSGGLRTCRRAPVARSGAAPSIGNESLNVPPYLTSSDHSDNCLSLGMPKGHGDLSRDSWTPGDWARGISPEPLTGPCLTVSRHTARAIQGALPPSVVISRFLPFCPNPVDPGAPQILQTVTALLDVARKVGFEVETELAGYEPYW
jgi:hypothetical protein